MVGLVEEQEGEVNSSGAQDSINLQRGNYVQYLRGEHKVLNPFPYTQEVGTHKSDV